MPDGISRGGFLNNSYQEISFANKNEVDITFPEIIFGATNGGVTGKPITLDEFLNKVMKNVKIKSFIKNINYHISDCVTKFSWEVENTCFVS